MTTQSDLRRLTATMIFFVCWLLLPAGLQAQLKYLTTVSGGGDFQIKITGYTVTASGTLVIPATINDLPVTTIGTSAFANQNQITGVDLPPSLTTIESYAFQNCSSLTSVTVPEGVTMLYDYAFWNCTSLVNASLPSGLTVLNTGVFQECSKLEGVTVPPGVTQIPAYAFYGCTALTTINLPAGVTTIGEYAFNGCANLSTITLPDNLISLGDRAFAGCTGLTSITLNPGLLLIGNSVFDHCASLTSINIPPVLSIGGNNFIGCDSLTAINVDASAATVSSVGGVYFNKDRTTLLAYPRGKNGTYTIPSGVTHIVTWAFSGANHLSGITLTEGLLSIDSLAFNNCDALTDVNLPASLYYFGNGAFSDCDNLTAMTVSAGNTSFASVNGVLFSASADKLWQYPTGKAGPYAIPPGVTQMEISAFAGAKLLTAVTIPDSLYAIPSYAFADCLALETISVGASVNYINNNAFLRCASLRSFDVAPANAYFASENGVLFNTSRTTLINFPKGKDGVYEIPAGVTTVGGQAFLDADLLETVIVPAGVGSLGDSGFADCALLTKVYFYGNAPTLINARSTFQNHTDGFAVYFFHDATGFTTPTWNGYPAVDMGGHRSFVAWLISHRLEHDTDPAVAANDAGVSLLESYALGLDPFDATATELPQAAFDAGNGALSIRYHAGTDGVIYTPEASTDLRQWTTDGVDVSPPDFDQHRTATVDVDGPARFLRLRLSL
ncbi:MAG: leucine-rich repeat domain-containing protein [Verrucomicrobiota bacterium]